MKHDRRNRAYEQGSSPQVDPQELVEFLAGQVVDDPQAVQVRAQGQNLLIRVAEGEEGRVIGRQGRVIQAIRTLTRAAAPYQRLNIDLDGPRREHRPNSRDSSERGRHS